MHILWAAVRDNSTWYAERHNTAGDIVNYDGSGTNYSSRSDRSVWHDARARSDQCPIANGNTACQYCAGRDMYVVADTPIMINYGSTIDYNIPTKLCSGLHNDAGHYLATFTEHDVLSEGSCWVHDRLKDEPKRFCAFKQNLPICWKARPTYTHYKTH
jgi:hypothetical protein